MKKAVHKTALQCCTQNEKEIEQNMKAISTKDLHIATTIETDEHNVEIETDDKAKSKLDNIA